MLITTAMHRRVHTSFSPDVPVGLFCLSSRLHRDDGNLGHSVPQLCARTIIIRVTGSWLRMAQPMIAATAFHVIMTHLNSTQTLRGEHSRNGPCRTVAPSQPPPTERSLGNYSDCRLTKAYRISMATTAENADIVRSAKHRDVPLRSPGSIQRPPALLGPMQARTGQQDHVWPDWRQYWTPQLSPTHPFDIADPNL